MRPLNFSIVHILKFLLIATFLVFSNSSLAQNGNVNDQIQYLKELKKMVKFYEFANLANLTVYKACVCQKVLETGKKNSSCQNLSASELHTIKFLNVFADQKSETNSCEGLLNRHILLRIKQDYPLMQKAAALGNPPIDTRPPDFQFRNLDYETLNGEQKFHFTTEPKHTVFIGNHSDDMIQNIAPLSAAQTNEVRADYDNNVKTKCLDFFQTYKGELKTQKFPAGFMTNPCSFLLDRQLTFKAFPLQEKTNILKVQNDYVSFAARSRARFIKGFKDGYSMLIQNNPLLLLVNSADPKPEDLVQPLNYLIQNATIRIKDELVLFQENQSLESLHTFLNFPYADFYAKRSLSLAGWSSDRIDKTRAEFNDYLFTKERNQIFIELGILTATLLVCYIPLPIKAVTIPLTLIYKNACFVTVGAAQSAVFAYTDLQDYHKELQKFFSTPDGEAFLNQFNELKEPQALEYVALAILPSLGNIKGLILEKHLKNFRNWKF